MNYQQIRDLLKLGRNHPIFKQDYQYAMHYLQQLQQSGDISYEEFRETSELLDAENRGNSRTYIDAALAKFSALQRYGYDELQLGNDMLEQIVRARRVCAHFYGSIDLDIHRPMNPDFLKYLQRLALETIKAYNAKENSVWDSYTYLKSAAIISITRGLTERGLFMDKIAAVIKQVGKYELEILKTVEKHDEVRYLRFFDTKIAEEPFDIDAEGVELIYKYLTNLYEFRDQTKAAHDRVYAAYKSGQLTESEYSIHNSKLAANSTDLQENGYCRPYDPILSYLWQVENNLPKEYMGIYTVEQMTKAAEFAKNFVSLFNNDFLKKEMVLKHLAVKLMYTPEEKELRDKLYTLVYSNLKMLEDHKVVTSSEFLDYTAKAKEKFS